MLNLYFDFYLSLFVDCMLFEMTGALYNPLADGIDFSASCR